MAHKWARVRRSIVLSGRLRSMRKHFWKFFQDSNKNSYQSDRKPEPENFSQGLINYGSVDALSPHTHTHTGAHIQCSNNERKQNGFYFSSVHTATNARSNLTTTMFRTGKQNEFMVVPWYPQSASMHSTFFIICYFFSNRFCLCKQRIWSDNFFLSCIQTISHICNTVIDRFSTRVFSANTDLSFQTNGLFCEMVSSK